ncbi:MAG: DNA polymerase III subunit gamma/tau [Acidobacteria bacterium]|nr:MAG: DNA polymerase III subunit gamma/tau [Acidobacteriota bacterium]
MTAYQVLARRWRPQRFEDLVGQDVVVRTLRNALSSGQIAHAYLFSGLRGVGKTTVARLLAKALNCEKGPTPEPCGECGACQDIAAGSSLDVHEIDAASNRGIDDIRELREVARVLPVRDRFRVFILDEAHQLSREAFAALLKILEEPPAHVVFILASTEKDKFPATILSRCLQVDFRPIPADLVAGRLAQVAESEGFELTLGATQLIARATEGSLRDALSLLDRVRAFAEGTVDENAVAEVVGLPPFEVVLALWRALEGGDVAAALGLVRAEERSGRDPAALYEQLVQLVHAALLLATDATAPAPFPTAHRAAIAESAARLGPALLVRLLALALEGKGLVAAAEKPGVAVAVAIGRLALWPRLQRVEALLAGEPAASTGGAPAPPARSAPPAVPPPAPAAGAPGARLAAALEAMGEHLLAGRVSSVREVAVVGDTVVLRCGGLPASTRKSLRDAVETLAGAARRAGLGERVEVDEDGAPARPRDQGVRARVEADEGVQRVLEVFGGRVESVEEKP